MDEGHELTEKELQRLEKRITAEYRQAAREVAAKYEAWNAKFAAADAKQQAKLAAGEISKADYQQWVLRQRMIGSDWKTMSDILAKDLVNADNIARKMIGEEMPNVYALNANYGTYQIERSGIDTGFTLYNHDTAEVLLKQENIALMPGPSGSKAEMLREAADLKWNRQKINSAVLQGVLQGEGAKKVAQRLMGVAQMDANAAIRYARTMTTSAQNAGRYQSYRRAKALGIDLTIEWQATLDNRTRHEHRMMHGQRREVDEPFEVSGFKILYPAEAKGKSSDIPQSMIWNCRCTLLAWVKGFEPDTVKSSPKMQGMSFEEWQTAKAPKGISDKLRATKAAPKTTPKTTPKAAPKQTLTAFTPEQEDAIEWYVSGEGQFVNQIMRGRIDGGFSEFEAEQVELLKQATDRPLPKDIKKLYRSVDASAVFGEMSMADFDSLQSLVVYGADDRYALAQKSRLDAVVGKTVTEKGFMSTTKDKEIALYWGDFTGSEKPIALSLDVPSGVKGADLKKFDVEGEEQREVLLHPNARYKIRSIGAEEGTIVVYAEIIP